MYMYACSHAWYRSKQVKPSQCLPMYIFGRTANGKIGLSSNPKITYVYIENNSLSLVGLLRV